MDQQAGEEVPLSSRAQKVADCLREHGALFFDELVHAARLLETELEDALAELVARGQVGCDSFSGLRALLQPATKRPASYARNGRRASLGGIADAGRWSLVRRSDEHSVHPAPQAARAEGIEHVARVLLRRYGVVCWRLLEREARWLPAWRELLREYQRLEARGEIRGGRFIAGVVGPQFALPEAVAALRTVRKRAHDGAMIVVSASDPLNLVGSLLPGDKVPRQPGARLLLRDGLPVAALVAGEFRPLPGLQSQDQHAANLALLRDPGHRPIDRTIDRPIDQTCDPARNRLLAAPGSRPQADPLGLHR
jgi:ATP-dependent Lhr-like helicase